MHTTEKQKAASQQNGSTGGVKTPEGKEVSRMNALKHGILSKLSTAYDLVSFESAYEDFAAEFGATTLSRQMLLEQLAITYVRLLRCARFESDKIRETLNPPKFKVKHVGLDLSIFDDETVLVAKNDQAPLSASVMTELEPLYLRYEPQLVKRMLRLLDRLERGE